MSTKRLASIAKPLLPSYSQALDGRLRARRGDGATLAYRFAGRADAGSRPCAQERTIKSACRFENGGSPSAEGASNEHRSRLRRPSSAPHRSIGWPRSGACRFGNRRRLRGGGAAYRRARPRHHRRRLAPCAAFQGLLPCIHRRRRPWGHGAVRRAGNVHDRAPIDAAFAASAAACAGKHGAPICGSGMADGELDHATFVPLSFVNEVYNGYRLVARWAFGSCF